MGKLNCKWLMLMALIAGFIFGASPLMPSGLKALVLWVLLFALILRFFYVATGDEN